MRLFTLPAAILLCVFSPAALLGQQTEVRPYQMERCEEFSLKSAAGTSYRITVSIPAEEAPEQGHAIAYVLDGDTLFPLMTSILRAQAGTAKGQKHNGIRPGIIVGIGTNGKEERDYDYTLNAPAGAPETYRNGKPYPKRKSGGADDFFAFLTKVVRPEIERRYKVNKQDQSLIGNGYGGLFALHVLFTRPGTFQTYVASSPSIWWNNAYILKEKESYLKDSGLHSVPAKLILSVGEMEQSLSRIEAGWDEEKREEHRLKITRRAMLDRCRELYWNLKNRNLENLDLTYRSFPNLSHKEVTPYALSHCLPLVFPLR